MGNNESKTDENTRSSNRANQSVQDKKPALDQSATEKKPTKTRTFVESKVDEATREAFDEWLNERLAKYFEDIQDKILRLKEGKNERNEIGIAVGEFLDFLFMETERVDRRFRFDNFRDVYKVGTYHENMEIITVDQLEYCLVVEDLSKENIESVNKVSTDDDEYVKVCLKENCAIRWEECVEKDSDEKPWLCSDERGIAEVFFDRVAKAIDEVRSKNRDSVYRKHGRLDLLEENGVIKQGASVELKFSWNKETMITVKLTPCVCYGDVNTFIDEESTLNASVLRTVKQAGKVILQPLAGTSDYFQWHTGHVELEFVKDHVIKTHTEVYRIMKFLVQGYNRNAIEEAEFFSDLVLKVQMITHCSRCQKKDKFGDCVLAIIDEMQKLLKTYRDDKTEAPFLGNCFYVYQNALPVSCRKRGENAINMNLAGLEQIANHLIKEIACTALYDFNKSIKNLVPLNAFILKKDYISRKYGTPEGKKAEEAEMEARKALVDAVSNQKFAVKF